MVFNTRPENLQQDLARLQRLIGERKHSQAEALARQLRAAHPRHPGINFTLGNLLSLTQQHEKSLPFLKAAAELQPQNGEYQLRFAMNLIELGRLAEAESVLKKALAADPKRHAHAWCLAKVHIIANRSEDALFYLRQALANAPAKETGAIRADLARILVGVGRIEEAKAEYALNRQDRSHAALSLAALADLSRCRMGDADYDAILRELRRSDLGEEERSALLRAKGNALENSRQYDEAFEAFRQSKPVNADQGPTERLGITVDLQREAMTREKIAEYSALYGDASAKPLFVIGMPRSGTTLIEQILTAHDAIGSIGETQAISHVLQVLSGGGGAAGSDLSEMPDPVLVREKAKFYLSLVESMTGGKTYAIDKMPHNFRYVGQIAVMFPKARFIHCVRHPADNFVSAFKLPMNRAHSYSYDPLFYARYYTLYARLMRHWYDVLPGRIFTVEYEKLTLDPEGVLKRLFDFLGLEWDSRVLDFHKRDNLVKTPSATQVRSAVNAASVNRWKIYDKQIGPLLAAFDEPLPLIWPA